MRETPKWYVHNMTSGQFRNPPTINCRECSTPVQWKGGRPRIYCSHKCGDRARKRAKYIPSGNRPKREGPPLTPKERAKRLRDRQKAIVRKEKLARRHCTDCGLQITELTLPCIAFDHRDPMTKSFTISYEIGRVGDERLIDEMSKCDAVCHNCHALRTHYGQHWAVRRD